MPTDLPIVCSLNAADLAERMAEIAGVGRDGLLHARSSSTRAELEFRDDPQIRARVQAIVLAETQCCAFLQMTLADRHGVIELSIAAPDGTELVLAEIVAAFGATAASV